MAEVLTTKLKSDTLRLVQDDFLNNEFYFAVSSISLDTLTTIKAVNSAYSKNNFKENLVFGKRILMRGQRQDVVILGNVFEEEVKSVYKYYKS